MFRYLYNAKGFALFLVLTFCSMSTADLAQNPTMGSFQKTTRSAQLDDNDEHRYVVMYRANSTHFSERLARSRRKLSGAVPIENFFPELNTEIVYIESEADIAALESEDDVMLVEKDVKVYLTEENIPPGITAVQSFNVSDSLVSNRKVCIIDSGYDINHPDLQNTSITGSQYNSTYPWDEDPVSHGTHVAGTIAAIGGNGIGVAGVVRNGGLQLQIVRAFGINGQSWIWASGLVDSAYQCVDDGAHIINMSFGGPDYSQYWESWFNTFYTDNDVLIIAAAGNGGDTSYSYPASFSTVMSVAAVDSNKDLANFSQRNNQVDISAPGVNILSTMPGGGYGTKSGTSMAAPHVTGVAALVWSHFPTMSAAQIWQALTDSAQDLGTSGRDDSFGHGFVQAKAAIDILTTMSPSSQPSSFPSTLPSGPPSSQPSSFPSTLPSGSPSSQASSFPSTLPSGSPSSQPSSFPSTLPSGSPSSSPFRLPTSPSPGPGGSGSGDPHFRTFNNQYFSYHGQCDLVLTQSPSLGLHVHIRTTRVSNHHMDYSYISGAAVKIGPDILEVSEDGELLTNGIEDAGDGDTDIDATKRYTVKKSFKGRKHNIIAYDIDLGNGKSIQIRSNIKNGMTFVDVNGIFEDTVGLLGLSSGVTDALDEGNPDANALLARDGVTDLTGHWNTFGEEWQVNAKDPKLFQKNDRHPQYPMGCLYDADADHETKSHIRRRRLMEEEASKARVTLKAASDACAHLLEDHMLKFCVNDIMATGDLDLVDDPFYSNQ